MERLTKKERVGLIAFSIILALGILIAAIVSGLDSGEHKIDKATQAEIEEFENKVILQESDTASRKSVKRRSKAKSGTVYQDIDPLKDKMERIK